MGARSVFSYRETGGRSLNTGEIVTQNGGLVEVTCADDAAKDVRRRAMVIDLGQAGTGSDTCYQHKLDGKEKYVSSTSIFTKTRKP